MFHQQCQLGVCGVVRYITDLHLLYPGTVWQVKYLILSILHPKLYLAILVYRHLNQVIYCLNALLSYLLVTAIITLSVYADIKISSFYH